MFRIRISRWTIVTLERPLLQVHRLNMAVQQPLPLKSPFAGGALKLLLVQMRRLLVRQQIRILSKGGVANRTNKWLLSGMDTQMILQLRASPKRLVALVARKRFVLGVGYFVLLQVPQRLERLWTLVTLPVLGFVYGLVALQIFFVVKRLAAFWALEGSRPVRVHLQVAIVSVLGGKVQRTGVTLERPGALVHVQVVLH